MGRSRKGLQEWLNPGAPLMLVGLSAHWLTLSLSGSFHFSPFLPPHSLSLPYALAFPQLFQQVWRLSFLLVGICPMSTSEPIIVTHAHLPGWEDQPPPEPCEWGGRSGSHRKSQVPLGWKKLKWVLSRQDLKRPLYLPSLFIQQTFETLYCARTCTTPWGHSRGHNRPSPCFPKFYGLRRTADFKYK